MASTDAVSNAGLVHITGADTCIVVASQAGNTNYVGSMAAPERAHHNHQSGRHHDSNLRCGSLHLPGSAITPCSPSVTGPGRLNHSLMVSYQNNLTPVGPRPALPTLGRSTTRGAAHRSTSPSTRRLCRSRGTTLRPSITQRRLALPS